MGTVSEAGGGVSYEAETATSIGAIPAAEKGAPNGVATLDSNGRVPIAELPVTLTGEANKIPQLDSGGTLTLNDANLSAQYSSGAIFVAGVGKWVNLDFSSQELDFIDGTGTVSIGISGIDAGTKPIVTTYVPAAPGDVLNKAFLDAQKGAANGLATLDASGKVPASEMNVSGLAYKGDWNASTNTPTLANGVGVNGDFYKVSVAGDQNLGGGVESYAVGDWVLYDGTAWDRFGAHEAVTSVNGKTGAVVLTAADVGVAAANPTATVGPAAINGVAATFMRSDAAPAINLTAAYSWTGAHSWSQSTNVAGTVSAAVTTARAGPTNTGGLISSAPNNADLMLFDSTQTANNRTVEWIFFQGKLQARFKNDAGSSAVVPLAFAGGQALGVTGIESNSGSGAWAHTGAFSATGPATVLPAGGNGVVTTGTNSSGVPSIEATGAANDISLEIKAKAGGSIGFTGAAYLWAGTAPWTVSGSTGAPGQVFTSTGNATAPGWSDAPLPRVVGGSSATAQSANVNTPNFYAVAVGGMYRVSSFIVITRAATTSATMPSVSVGYTEAASGANVQDIVTLSSVANTVGSHSGGTAVLQCQQGSNISYSTSNYASSGATSMQYRVDVLVERLT